jgi:hypothetical protein
MPEWYLVIIALAATSLLGTLWRPVLVALPLLALAVLGLVVQAASSAARARLTVAPRSRLSVAGRHALTACLHLLQPLARLHGRLHQGLTPWRRPAGTTLSLPRPQAWAIRTSNWEEPDRRLLSIEAALRALGVGWRRGGGYDRWDLEVRGGAFGAARILMAVEDHGAGTQYVRIRSWPRCSGATIVSILAVATLAVGAVMDGAWAAATALGSIGGLLGVRTVLDGSAAMAALLQAARAAGVARTCDGSDGGRDSRGRSPVA